ncbi:hypothetical protein ACTMTJ_04395 [Phytohabitans sp. LJ34]|uniref:hypothetical protein n=1 Tax=Phytohabitans sp. LJ34 TaxID=3452217 RepID=UPI003F8CEDAF
MAAGFYVRVPPELAGDLHSDGFLRRGDDRGAGEVLDAAQAAAAVLGAGLGLGADAVSILVGRHEVARLVRRLWRSSRPDPAGRRRITVAVGHTPVGGSVVFETDGYATDDLPEKLVEAVATLLTALADEQSGGAGA